MSRSWMYACVAVAALSCSSPFEPASRVVRTRLLAVTADHPYARVGEQVVLDALALDPSGRPLTFAWATCRASAATVGGCLETMDRSTLIVEQGRTRHTIVADAAYVGVIVAVCPGALTLGDTSGVPFVCTVDGRRLAVNEFDVGVKRVLVREDRNQNPTIDRVTFGGVDWTESALPEVTACDPGDDVDACADKTEIRVTGGPAEPGENVLVQYYATEGTFSSEVRTLASPETTWVARRAASGTTITFAIVIRDDRGGASFVLRRARVRS